MYLNRSIETRFWLSPQITV